MKSIKFLSVLALFFTVVLFQSCEDDPCEDVTCLNNGVCVDGNCDCPDGYSGTDCGTHCSASVAGTYTITDASDPGGTGATCNIVSYTIGIGATISDVTVSITDVGGAMGDGTGTLSADCKTITYNMPGPGIDGTITLDGNTMTDVMTFGGGFSCTFVGSK